MPDKIELLVCSDDWHGLPTSCKHLLTQFLPDTPITWVETIGLRSPRLSRYDVGRSVAKVAGWIRRTPRETRKLPDNLCVKDLFQIPYNNISSIRAFNMKRLVECAGSVRPGYKRVFVTTWPFLGDVVGKLGESVSVYYRVDDFSEFPGVNTHLIIRLEEELMKKVDIVAATADKLMPKNKASHLVKSLPHGVDYNHFASKARPCAMENPLSAYPVPRIGYFGLLDSWIDFEFIKGIADLNPSASVVIVGPSQLPEADLPHGKNIHYTGVVDYTELPTYAAWFDVALIPFKVNRLTRAVNPLKLLEYFALGLPVVSTSLPEVVKYGDVVSVVSDAQGATDAIKRILAGDGEAERKSRQKIALERSWQERARELRGWIEEILAEKR